jgi:hypothetical protein
MAGDVMLTKRVERLPLSGARDAFWKAVSAATA